MTIKYLFLNLLLLVVPVCFSYSQNDTSHFSCNGYFSFMELNFFEKPTKNILFQEMIQNRIHLVYSPSQSVELVIAMRNRIIAGDFVKLNPYFADETEKDNGFFKLSANIGSAASYVTNVLSDRLYFDFSKGRYQVTAGRQRINWGQCYAWNPNDLFNTYSFFDIDYEEKPGCDALRMQYYPSPVSAVEMVATADSSKKITFALLSRFNKYGYDFQFLAAWYRQHEVAAGAGWSGNIYNLGFRGEATVFIPTCRDSSSTALFSAGLDYVFTNSLYLNVEFLYNQHSVSLSDPAAFVTGNIFSPKNISFSEYNALFQVSYPVTPLFNTSLATMYFPGFDGFFISPSISYSLSANSAVSVASQSFGGKFFGNDTMSYMHFVYLRLKLNF